MYDAITAIILSGGKSSRMGQNKSLFEINGKTIIEDLYLKIKSIFKNIILVTNDAELYDFIKEPKVKDIFIGKGPLGGIHSGLMHSQTEKNFIISCDLPLITLEAIDFIISKSENQNITLPLANGFVQELCGVYSKSLISNIEEKLEESNKEEIRHHEQKHRGCKVHSFIKENNALIIDFEKEFSFYNENLFFNLNTPEDLEKITQIL